MAFLHRRPIVCEGQRLFSRFLLVEAEAVDEIAASTSLITITCHLLDYNYEQTKSQCDRLRLHCK